jgi:hypothetical protein
VGYLPDSNEVRAEAEESAPLEAFTRKWLVKTADQKDLARAVVFCKV